MSSRISQFPIGGSCFLCWASGKPTKRACSICSGSWCETSITTFPANSWFTDFTTALILAAMIEEVWSHTFADMQ
ncbi:hypothetical protein GBAR_LOCUS6568 [Geodia barretti]|uniref:Uncharacterized protein n=1 Tax=Geodia barretti TaxID=519541 RepID=A0AA35WCR2_GEOBA|nr:hypothetical protein GBAR_LOCUS6568 [Geodia barretti]